MPLFRCKAVESHSFRFVFVLIKYVAQVELSICMPLCRCHTVPSRSLRFVLRNTFTYLM